MGSPFAPKYANSSMDTIERHILNSAPVCNKPILWLRFIAVIFAGWTLGRDSLSGFLII